MHFNTCIRLLKTKKNICLKVSPSLLLYLVDKVHSVTKVSPFFRTDIKSEISLPHVLSELELFSVLTAKPALK